MRNKKSLINVVVNIITYLIIIIPNFFTRRIFLSTLGEELLGLNSLFSNIIGLLSIIELGIGPAIIYSLYAPFAKGDRTKVKAYLNYYNKFYKSIGIIIILLGLAISINLNIFISNPLDSVDIRKYFILYLISSAMTYFFSYKFSILTVAQEGYIISINTAICKLIMNILQIVLLLNYPRYDFYIIIQIFTDLIFYIIVNMIINKKYSWILNNKEKLEKSERKSLSKNLRAIFMHKIGGFVVFGTDNLIISKFVNIKSVAIFNSYNLILSSLQNLIDRGLDGVTASIGNLLTIKDDDKSYEIHRVLMFINFWIVSFITISLYNTIDQFVVLWLGESQKIDNLTLNILLINFYFTGMRASINKFKDGSGNYYRDRYAPIFESIINLVSSILLVKKIGLPGVFIGTLISNLTIVFWVKPRIVYKYVFKRKTIEYFKEYFKYFTIFLLMLLFTNILTINIRNSYNIVNFVINCLINILVINITYLIIFMKKEEWKYIENNFIRDMRLKYKKGKV